MRVLLAEDHPDLAEVIVELLTGEGHTVTQVPHLVAAQQLAATGAWDVLLVDRLYPHSSEVPEEERALLRTLASHAPVVVQTGRAWAKDVLPADLGVAAILHKPYDLDLLLQTLRSIGAVNCRSRP